MFIVPKTIDVELNAYHGGSLNGKDIKKVMNNSTYVFDKLASIFKERKRPNCLLPNDDMDALSAFSRGVFFMGWDIFISKDKES
jgi:hypothetical protein